MADDELIKALLRSQYSDPALEPSGYLPGRGLPSLPPLPQEEPGAGLASRGEVKRGVTDHALSLAQFLYRKATEPSPIVHANRYEATFGAASNLPWADYHDQLMRNLLGRWQDAVPAGRTAPAAYNALLDPEHPITQEKQNTKEGATLAGLAAMELAMPWIAKTGPSMTAPPALSRHPNQLGENIYMSLPAMMAAWYGIKPTK